MNVDVVSEIEIDRPASDVARYASDPSNAPEWYDNIRSIVWLSEPAVRVGATMTFVAQFLGRRLEYTYEIVEFIESERLVMRTAQGPFPMQTTYTWAPVSARRCRMTLRNQGSPTGFSKLVAPLMTPAMRRANRKDLERLRQIIEARS
jgi:uncharacterized membrane protein